MYLAFALSVRAVHVVSYVSHQLVRTVYESFDESYDPPFYPARVLTILCQMQLLLLPPNLQISLAR